MIENFDDSSDNEEVITILPHHNHESTVNREEDKKNIKNQPLIHGTNLTIEKIKKLFCHSYLFEDYDLFKKKSNLIKLLEISWTEIIQNKVYAFHSYIFNFYAYFCMLPNEDVCIQNINNYRIVSENDGKKNYNNNFLFQSHKKNKTIKDNNLNDNNKTEKNKVEREFYIHPIQIEINDEKNFKVKMLRHRFLQESKPMPLSFLFSIDMYCQRINIERPKRLLKYYGKNAYDMKFSKNNISILKLKYIDNTIEKLIENNSIVVNEFYVDDENTWEAIRNSFKIDYQLKYNCSINVVLSPRLVCIIRFKLFLKYHKSEKFF